MGARRSCRTCCTARRWLFPFPGSSFHTTMQFPPGKVLICWRPWTYRIEPEIVGSGYFDRGPSPSCPERLLGWRRKRKAPVHERCVFAFSSPRKKGSVLRRSFTLLAKGFQILAGWGRAVNHELHVARLPASYSYLT